MFKPDWFEKAISDMRGRTLYGDPVLRVVWGPTQRDFNGRHKYVRPEGGLMECWVLERHQPAGFFGTRDEWEKSDRFFDDVRQEWVNLKGEYPSRGQYTMVCPLTDREGNYVPLDETVLRGIRQKISKDEEFAQMGVGQRTDFVNELQRLQDAQRESEADRRQEDLREYWLKNWDQINRSETRAYSTHPR